MRLAILSDIHGNQLALEAVLNDLKQAGTVEKTWVLGDLCALGPRPAECLQIIREMPEAQVISGNTDRYLITGALEGRPVPKDAEAWQKLVGWLRRHSSSHLWTMDRLNWQDAEYLTKLHHGLDLHVPGYGYVVGYHGSPGNDEYMLLPDTPDEEVLDQFLDAEGRLGFGGHTHLPMDRDLGRWRVVNVGSVSLPKNDTHACYVIADLSASGANVEFRHVDYDRDAVITDLKQQNFPDPDWLIPMINGDWSQR